MNGPLVSVVIPSYNHSRFLPDAIDSIRGQTMSRHEIIVVDDGSTDNTREVVASHTEVKYIYQENRGLAGARNTGIRNSEAPLVSFLDADDVLRPYALEVGERLLAAHPECAFASGKYRVVGADLQPFVESAGTEVNEDHYLALLRGNYIGMHAAVMYRRVALESAGGYSEKLRACEDYDLYLRIARTKPVLSHAQVVADYRWHGANMSADPRFMLEWVLKVHRAQAPFVKGNGARMAAYLQGERDWRAYYAGEMRNRLAEGKAKGLLDRAAGYLFVMRNDPSERPRWFRRD